MMRRQLIESESHELLLRPNALSTSDNPSQGKLDDVEDTQEGDENEEIDIFDTFKFTSFRTRLAIDERYDMVNLKDPEEPEPIELKDDFPKEKIDRG